MGLSSTRARGSLVVTVEHLTTLFSLLKTSVSLFIVPSACWAWRRQLEKEQEV